MKENSTLFTLVGMVIGFIFSLALIWLGGLFLSYAWGQGLDTLTGYQMTRETATLIILAVFVFKALFWTKIENKTYTGTEALQQVLTVGISRIVNTLIAWLVFFVAVHILL